MVIMSLWWTTFKYERNPTRQKRGQSHVAATAAENFHPKLTQGNHNWSSCRSLKSIILLWSGNCRILVGEVLTTMYTLLLVPMLRSITPEHASRNESWLHVEKWRWARIFIHSPTIRQKVEVVGRPGWTMASSQPTRLGTRVMIFRARIS